MISGGGMYERTRDEPRGLEGIHQKIERVQGECRVLGWGVGKSTEEEWKLN